MKLHLPSRLRQALLFCLMPLVIPMLTLPMMAAEETEENAPLPPGRFSHETASLSGTYSQGIFADVSRLKNEGVIKVTGAQEHAYLGVPEMAKGGYFGISLMHSSTLSNNGTINITTSGGSNDAEWGTSGLSQTSGSLNNDGEITISVASSHGNACGIYLDRIVDADTGDLLEDSNSLFTNRGTINIAAKASNSSCISYGFYIGRGDIINNEQGASIGISSADVGIYSYGMFNNRGIIDIKNSVSKYGFQLHEGTLDNSGSIAIASAIIGLESYGELINRGSIDISHVNTTTSDNHVATGGALLLRAGTLNNSGTIKLSGVHGIYQEAGTLATNSGILDIVLNGGNIPTYGIESREKGAHFTNTESGSIAINTSEQSIEKVTYGIYYELGTLDNSGEINIAAEKCAIYNGTDNSLTNHSQGLISIKSENTGIESHGSLANNQNGDIVINAGYYGIKSDGIITNGGSLDITTTKGAAAWTYGINLSDTSAEFTNTLAGVVTIQSARYAIESCGSITNRGRITVDGDINSHGTLDNSGTIEMNTGNIVAYGAMTNSGTITGSQGSINLTNEGSLDNSGSINLDAGTIDGNVTNSGSISAGKVSGSLNNTTGGLVSTQSFSGYLENNGDINITGATETGMNLNADSVNNGNITIDSNAIGLQYSSFTNNGSMEISSGSGDALSILFYGGTALLTNTGDITIHAAENGVRSASINNSGVLSITAANAGAYFWGSATKNAGTMDIVVTGETASYGLKVENRFANMGNLSIEMAHPEAAPGILLVDDLCNSGELHTKRIEGSFATAQLYLLDGSVTGAAHGESLEVLDVDYLCLGGTLGDDWQTSRTESGSVVTVDSALSLSGSHVRVVDDVRLKMGGDLTLGNDCDINCSLLSDMVAEDGSIIPTYATLTIDNGDTAHRVSITDNFSAKWDGAVAVNYANDQYTQTIELHSEGGNTMNDVTLSSKNITIESAEGSRTAVQDMELTASSGVTLANLDLSGNSSITSTASGDSSFRMDMTDVNVGGNFSITSASGSFTLNADGVTYTDSLLLIQANSSSIIYNEGSLHVDKIEALSSAGINLLHGSTTGAISQDKTLIIDGSGARVVLGGEPTDWGAVTSKDGGSVVTVDSNLSILEGTLSARGDVRLKMGGDLLVAEAVSLSNEFINGGGCTLTVDNGATAHHVTMGSRGKVDAAWNGGVTVEWKDSGRDIALHSEGGNSISNGSLYAKTTILVDSAEGTKTVLENVVFELETVNHNGEITLNNVEVRGDCSFTVPSGAITLNADGVTFVLDESNSTGMGLEPVTLFSVDPLTQTEVSPSVFYIDSSMLEGVNVAGNMTLDLSYWTEEIKAGGYDNIALTFADDMAFGEETQVKATLNGSNFAVADYKEDNMVQFSVANLPTEVVPEPTTVTLSLLALTALAARRRRK